MQVHRIQSNQTSFGYNRQANMELLEMLAKNKPNTPASEFYALMCQNLMKVEDDLRNAVTKEKKDTILSLIDSLITFKPIFVEKIQNIFPKFNYRQKEINAYVVEIEEFGLDKYPDHWINTIMQELTNNEVMNRMGNLKTKIEKLFSKTFTQNEIPPEVREQIIHDILSQSAESMAADDERVAQEAQAAINSNAINTENSEKTQLGQPDDKNNIEIGRNAVNHYTPTTDDEMRGFASLSGMDELKKQLTEEIIYPLKNPDLAKRDDIEYPRGIMLYGPPGTGKTTIVRRLSTEAGLTLLEVTRDTFASIYRDGSEVLLKGIFDYAKSIATKETPVLLLFDDIDTSIASRNEGGMAQHHKGELNILFNKLEKAHEDYIIPIATTNNYDQLDGAIKSRFSEANYYVGLPDKDARESFIKTKLIKAEVGVKLSNDKEALDEIGKLTDKFDYRALNGFVKGAKKAAVHDKKSPRRDITLDDFKTVIADSQELKYRYDYRPDAKRTTAGFNTGV